MGAKLYEKLGLSAGASKDDVKKAYKKMAIQHHPDKGGDPEVFKEISNAYQVLSDDQKKGEYDSMSDEMWENHMAGGGGPPGGGFPGGDPFAAFFGGMFNQQQQQGPVRRRDHVHGLRISQRDAYHGLTKTVKVNVTMMCEKCRTKCHPCDGRGNITDMRQMGPFMRQMFNRQCDACGGTGYRSPGCEACGGKGNCSKDHTIEMKIPAGVQSGAQMMHGGLGEQACAPGEIPGNLIFVVQINDDLNFAREGNNLVHKPKISLADAITGAKIVVPHYAGDIEIDTAREYGIVRPGPHRYVIKNKGMPPNGDLFIEFDIEYPEKGALEMTEDARETIRSVLTVKKL